MPRHATRILHTWHQDYYSEVNVSGEPLLWVAQRVERDAHGMGEEGKSACEAGDLSVPHAAILIRGITSEGRQFRPSDWCQRLAAAATVNCGYCSNARGRVINPYVKVIIEDGVHGLWISQKLKDIDMPLYEFMLRFGQDNGLQLAMFGQGVDS